LLPLSFIALLLIIPIAAIAVSWLTIFSDHSGSLSILQEMAQTVLPQYLWESFLLCVCVAIISGVMGTTSAALVTMFQFKGRRALEWGLLLPLAMPAYVVAYAYTDFLQYSGPAQNWLRQAFTLQGRVLPEIRNVWGAALIFSFCLYPYVYLLVRTALSERATHLMQAAQLLGASLTRRVLKVALPLARPAIAAGIALVLMETLADFGVVSYFGIQTFSAGIYKAWLAMDNHLAAAQLATVLLIIIALLLRLEQKAQERLRFITKTPASNPSIPLIGKQALAAQVLCALPVLLGFVLPVLFMLHALYGQMQAADIAIPWEAFMQWSFNSLRLALTTAGIAVACALMLAFAARTHARPLAHRITQLTALGYAIPGTVVVVGLLLPLGWIQSQWPQWGIGYWLTTTSLGLIWAYLVRFNAVALHSLQSGYSRIPQSLDESAKMLGSTPTHLLTKVHMPLLKRSIVTAALLVFVDVMKELPVTLVLRPFNSDTLAVMTYNLARDERLGEAALPALALVLVGLIPVLWLNRLVPPTGIEPVSSA
jgi:iron(III) transport system permease protein